MINRASAQKEIQRLNKRVEEAEKVILMIHKRGTLDFDDEGWDLYEKVVQKLTNKEQTND